MGQSSSKSPKSISFVDLLDVIRRIIEAVVNFLEDKKIKDNVNSGTSSYKNDDIERLIKYLKDGSAILNTATNESVVSESQVQLQVGIFDPAQTTATERFIELLHGWLPNRVKLENLNLRETEDSDIYTHTIVLCNTPTRLGADIEEAVGNVNYEKRDKILVIVLHVKDESNLPCIATEKVFQENEDYKDIKNVVDMAYTKDHGIYDCDMNNYARKKFFEYLHIKQPDMSQI